MFYFVMYGAISSESAPRGVVANTKTFAGHRDGRARFQIWAAIVNAIMYFIEVSGEHSRAGREMRGVGNWIRLAGVAHC